jgi:hypothetical protein
VSHVDRLVRDIKNGKWVDGLEPIQVLHDVEGKWVRLLSGQHRLMAIAKSGYPKSVKYLIVLSGYDPDNGEHLTDALDSGKVRKSKDVLDCKGVMNSAVVSGTLTTYARNMMSLFSPTNAEIGHLYESYKFLFDVDYSDRGGSWAVAKFDGSGKVSVGFTGAVFADMVDGHLDAAKMWRRVLKADDWTQDDTVGNPLFKLRKLVDRSIGQKTTNRNQLDCYFIAARKCLDMARKGMRMRSSMVPKALTGIFVHGALTKADAAKYTNRPSMDPTGKAYDHLYPKSVKKANSGADNNDTAFAGETEEQQ